MQMLSHQFYYSAKDDNIKLTIGLGSQMVALILKTEAFIEFFGSMTTSGTAFFEEVKKRKAEGSKEDVKFDIGAWDELMDKREEQ